MKSFLLKNKKPICKWGLIPDNTFFEGELPETYSLAVCPSEGYIVLDIDRHGDVDGFKNVPVELVTELAETFNYPTKNNGRHYWFKYSGKEILANKASGIGIDLRTEKGYVVYYPKDDIRGQMHLVKETSTQLNNWLEKLFSYV